MHLLDYPLIGNMLKEKALFECHECWSFWEYYAEGFSFPNRDLTHLDVSIQAKESLLKAMSSVLKSQRPQLLVKITGWPRMGYIREVFQDVKFVHISRDPIAVINSFLKVDWWWGRKGPKHWRWGELSASDHEQWLTHHRSIVALAAIQYNIYTRSLHQARASINDHDLLHITYEELCQYPIETIKKIISFCNLEWSTDLEVAVKLEPLNNTNNQIELSKNEINMIHSILENREDKRD